MRRKTRHIIIILFLVALMSCERDASQRKIRLSDENSSTDIVEQISTTLHFEPGTKRSIAVMFFENRTGDKDLQWLQKGLTEMLIRSLSQSPSLNVLSIDRLFEIMERLKKETSGNTVDLDMAAVIAEEANVEAVLFGQVVRRGDSLQIRVKVRDPGESGILKETSVEGEGLENLFSMVDELTSKIRTDLNVTFEKSDRSKSIAELTTNSLDAWQHYTTAIELRNQFLPMESAEELKQALAIDSNFVAANIQLYQLSMYDVLSGEAVRLMNRLKTLKERATPRERYQIDIIEAAVNNDAIALLEALQDWVKNHPDDVEANYSIGEVYSKWNNHDLALEYLLRAIEVDPKYKLAYNRLGYEYAGNGDFDKSLEYLNKYKSLAPDEHNPYDSLGDIYFRMGEYKRAEKNYKKALDIREDYYPSRLNLIYLNIEKGKFDKAIKMIGEYETAVALKGKEHKHSLLGMLYHRKGDIDRAIQNYEAALEEDPYAFINADLLIDIYAKRGVEHKGIELLEKTYNFIKKDLNDPILKYKSLFSLGWLSITWGVLMDESIDIIESEVQVLNRSALPSMKKSNLVSLKFMLTLLNIEKGQYAEANALWPEEEIFSKELWNVFANINAHSYSDDWESFERLNKAFQDSMIYGEEFYQPLIKFAADKNVKSMEMMFRLMLSHLYDSNGLMEKANSQLNVVGAPNENLWMIAGPFSNVDGFHKKYEPEKRIRIRDSYSDRNRSISWMQANDGREDGFIDFRKIYEPHHLWAVAYALIYIESPTEQGAELRFGTDDGGKIWFNDELVWRLNEGGPAVFDDYRLKVTLKRGMNKILVKVCNNPGDWGYFFRITDENGDGLRDIRYLSADSLDGSA
jgi:tetratricopeptide (TPR) repeat protein